ncbi:platelet glycoprotein Ib alpha chain-like [Argopecten irradians]|uniref:platelet glycoprotein Ib alpha chain-like n=1 Tax=Argopecten irradians TaxID=31199 RepID=UPI003716D957
MAERILQTALGLLILISYSSACQSYLDCCKERGSSSDADFDVMCFSSRCTCVLFDLAKSIDTIHLTVDESYMEITVVGNQRVYIYSDLHDPPLCTGSIVYMKWGRGEQNCTHETTKPTVRTTATTSRTITQSIATRTVPKTASRTTSTHETTKPTVRTTATTSRTITQSFATRTVPKTASRTAPQFMTTAWNIPEKTSRKASRTPSQITTTANIISKMTSSYRITKISRTTSPARDIPRITPRNTLRSSHTTIPTIRTVITPNNTNETIFKPVTISVTVCSTIIIIALLIIVRIQRRAMNKLENPSTSMIPLHNITPILTTPPHASTPIHIPAFEETIEEITEGLEEVSLSDTTTTVVEEPEKNHPMIRRSQKPRCVIEV